ncbi:MAG: DNA repair and recombination protein RadA [Candidatus Heimdallarchaeota archaeon]|nr:MAG: DNA repair and recombination protein RadA [Candidatus Heimdallarchaeota archaeon]
MAKVESKEKGIPPKAISETEKPKKSQKKTTDSEKPFLKTISGIGPTTRQRLEEAGYGSKESIALATKAQLTEISGIAEKTAALLIREARARFDLGLKKGSEYEASAKTRVKLTTGSQAFDSLLGGGFETGSITELAGENGCGKTQIAHQLAINCVKFLDQDVVWIDTEGTFRFNRIVQIAEAAGMDPDTVLSRITVGRAYNSEHQMALTEEALTMVPNVGLIIVDSLMAHFRSEFAGRGTLAERQQLIGKHLSFISKQAEILNCVGIVTNQVSAKPDAMFFGDPNKPVGGNVVGHTVTSRLMIRKGKAIKRTATLTKSPELPDGKIEFAITGEGVQDYSK